MKFSRYIIVALALAAGLQACRKETAGNDGLQPDKDHPIAWRASVQTKADALLTTEALKTTPFGVQAYWTDKGVPYGGPGVTPYLDNRKVVYDSGEDIWECDPKAWWLLGKQISFFAYAPWTDDLAVFKFATDGTALLRGEFAQNDDPELQPDFLVAAPALDKLMTGGPVPLTFKHALSNIRICLNITGDTEGHKFKLKSMSLGGVAGSGKFSYNTSAGGFTWDEIPRSDLSVRNKTYNLSIADGTLQDTWIKHVNELTTETGLDRYVWVNDVTGGKGELMLLPQPLTSITELTMNLDAYKDDGMGNWVYDSTEAPFRLILPAETSWEAGNIYYYTITLDVTHRYIIQFGITIQPWGSYSQTVIYP